MAKEPVCPWTGDPCMEHGCRMFVHMTGENPQTGQIMDIWNCTFALMPLLLIENSKMQHETGAAVESFRNEMARQNETSQALVLKAIGVGKPVLEIEGK